MVGGGGGVVGGEGDGGGGDGADGECDHSVSGGVGVAEKTAW